MFPSLSAVWMIFMPRSPSYLVSKGDIDGARKSLKWFRGGAAADVEEELEEIKNVELDRFIATTDPFSFNPITILGSRWAMLVSRLF